MDTYHLTAETIDSFGRYLLSEEKSPGTVSKYLHDVRTFSAWLAGRAVTRELSARSTTAWWPQPGSGAPSV